MNDATHAKQHLQQKLEGDFKQWANLVDPLWEFLTLLHKWNAAYNLTALRDMESMISKHVLDSLAIAPWIRGSTILDVGTGAGLPGIPLALAFPDIHWVLLDSNGKKIRFLKEVKRQLQLDNVALIEKRAESYQPSEYFDTVLSRAFSSVTQMMQWTRHLLAKDGLWLAMKGHIPEAELSLISHPYSVHEYTVDGVDGARCCVLIHNTIKE